MAHDIVEPRTEQLVLDRIQPIDAFGMTGSRIVQPAVGVGDDRQSHGFIPFLKSDLQPALGDHYGVTVEVHVFDRQLDLYGQTIWVEWIEYLRGQEAFDSAEALIRQMDEDSARAREALAKL